MAVYDDAKLELKAHQQERVPTTPPIDARKKCRNGARRQGSAPPRKTSAPLPPPRCSGGTDHAMGGSGGNTCPICRTPNDGNLCRHICP
jgi:hypothetical protein